MTEVKYSFSVEPIGLCIADLGADHFLAGPSRASLRAQDHSIFLRTQRNLRAHAVYARSLLGDLSRQSNMSARLCVPASAMVDFECEN